MRRGEETWGGVSPHHPTMGLVLEERRIAPPARILCTSEVRKKPPETRCSVFLSDDGASKRRWARGNFPPPLDGPGNQ